MNKNTGKVFDRDWFQKHQKVLVWLINTWLGRLIFRYRKMGHYPTNRIVGISPNSITEFVRFKGKRIELRQHFFSRNEYARKLYFVLFPMWWAMHAWDTLFANRFAPQLNFGFDTLTVYPAVGQNTPVDGRIENSNNTFSTARTAANGNAMNDTEVAQFFAYCSFYSPTYYIRRGFYLYNTSALTVDATISAAVHSLAGDGNASNNNDTSTIEVVSSSPAATNILALGDYSQVGVTSFASLTIANYVVTNGTYNNMALNAEGRATISKTGISKFGLRIGRDLGNQAPAGVNRVRAYFADNASYKPKLVVTYTLPAVVGAAFLFNMI